MFGKARNKGAEAFRLPRVRVETGQNDTHVGVFALGNQVDVTGDGIILLRCDVDGAPGRRPGDGKIVLHDNLQRVKRGPEIILLRNVHGAVAWVREIRPLAQNNDLLPLDALRTAAQTLVQPPAKRQDRDGYPELIPVRISSLQLKRKGGILEPFEYGRDWLGPRVVTYIDTDTRGGTRRAFLIHQDKAKRCHTFPHNSVFGGVNDCLQRSCHHRVTSINRRTIFLGQESAAR
mmetsp:Transcript_536/g.1416  ORF Transcript_536/g.1416 Transcript_536/m.1416 type:complete len:233 (-) Transcript_536:1491-2189(-)